VRPHPAGFAENGRVWVGSHLGAPDCQTGRAAARAERDAVWLVKACQGWEGSAVHKKELPGWAETLERAA
jgi:hypothetical protein